MIVREKINRFASNFGRMPTSITLANSWTTPITATNIEQGGSSFDSESDFGDGLSGVSGGLGDITDDLHTLFDSASLLMWPITIYGIYSVVIALTKSEPARKRKSAISKAKADLQAAKKMSRWSY